MGVDVVVFLIIVQNWSGEIFTKYGKITFALMDVSTHIRVVCHMSLQWKAIVTWCHRSLGDGFASLVLTSVFTFDVKLSAIVIFINMASTLRVENLDPCICCVGAGAGADDGAHEGGSLVGDLTTLDLGGTWVVDVDPLAKHVEQGYHTLPPSTWP